MNFEIKTTTEVKIPAKFIADSILAQLKAGKSVLFFITGGSSVAVASVVADILKKEDHKNLTVMLTDERYGPLDHKDSNWRQQMEKGFDLPDAKLIPILTGDDIATTVEKFKENLAYEINVSGYTIGLFGVGRDGHTCGILPESPAVRSKELVCAYETPTFTRITITPELIKEFDEAVVHMMGEEKWGVVKDLQKNIDIMKAPVQVLKKLPLLTVFTDFPVLEQNSVRGR
jgi:6-phosphogluconolactonase/glucosamine-6-phosphate isomerase/deaminase